ncbi:hypothetical protein RRF57_000676 [Xylaria bambusicola]|uniref:Uncharacterized protein n=1 Tax=Xylaria bambusicola TaxID=326684 RepID=A0AAN7U3Y0_9PEZI
MTPRGESLHIQVRQGIREVRCHVQLSRSKWHHVMMIAPFSQQDADLRKGLPALSLVNFRDDKHDTSGQLKHPG